MYNVGLIGLGYWGKKIREELEKNPFVDFVKIATTSPWLSPENIFRDRSISHVFVATPVETHYELCKRALLSGKHVLCEKNFTENYCQALELAKLADKKKLNLAVDYIHTFTLPKVLPSEVNDFSFGKIEIKQYGRFKDEHVFSVLGSHALSVLGTYIDLSEYKIVRANTDFTLPNYSRESVTQCLVEMENSTGQELSVFVSLEYLEGKIRQLSFYKNDYCLYSDSFAKPDGIKEMINKVLQGYSNIELALEVTKKVEEVVNFV